MEYLNAGDWKGLLTQTGCEEFAQQHTQFYADVSWENETLKQDCNDAVEFILSKDNGNLKVIWELPGVPTMLNRKDAALHSEIEALIEVVENAVDVASTDGSNISPDSSNVTPNINPNSVIFDTTQSPFKTLEDAEALINTKGAVSAYYLVHAALHSFLQQACSSNRIAIESNDSMTVLFAKVGDCIKGQTDTDRSDKSLSMLRTGSLIVATINDLKSHQGATQQNEDLITVADARFAINLVRSIMAYIDALIG